jgi:hypothetical protein
MSHHYSGPDWGFPRGDARLDLTDLYAFQKPEDLGRSILVMNVHPSVHDYLDRENPLGPTTAEPFAPDALYEFNVDTDGDAVAEIAYRVRFSSSNGGVQTATLSRAEGAQGIRAGYDGQTLIEGALVSTGREARVTKTGDYRFFAGWRSDPFFFDRQGAVNDLQFTGDDFFADKNVCSVVLEVPNSALGDKKVGLWHRTLVPVDSTRGGWVQVERGARPLQLFLVLGLSGAEKDAYISGAPADDVRFVGAFAHALEHTGGYKPEEAKRVARTLLPEVLRYDPMQPTSFPDNGRSLTDDAVDVFLHILTNGKVTGDKVGPHADMLPEFPYLGVPHNP